MSCLLFADGASRGNPGPAGAGAALFDATGRELAARSLFLGQCTNNAAEYRALLLGLEMALDAGCACVDIRLDSELLVRQLQGRYKVRHEGLKPLFEKARGLLARFEAWSVAHVPREQNKRADQLANQGVDQGRTGGNAA